MSVIHVDIPVCTAHKAHADCVHLYLYRCPQPTRPTRTVFTDINTCVNSSQGPHGLCSPLTIPVCVHSLQGPHGVCSPVAIPMCVHILQGPHGLCSPVSIPVCAQPTRPTRTVFTCIYTCVHSLQGPHGLCSSVAILLLCVHSPQGLHGLCSPVAISVFTYIYSCVHSPQGPHGLCSLVSVAIPVCAHPTRPTRIVFTCSYTCVCTTYKAHTHCVHL